LTMTVISVDLAGYLPNSIGQFFDISRGFLCVLCALCG
jgi:hypothetical protein